MAAIAAAYASVARRSPWSRGRGGVADRDDAADRGPHRPYRGRLPQALELGAYSFAPTNVIKHAHASRVEIHVTVADQQLVVTVSDEGVGGVDRDAGNGSHGPG
jgi:hypothetical protein